jgi:hypothetical protein
MPLTSEDEGASPARPECQPSLVREPGSPLPGRRSGSYAFAEMAGRLRGETADERPANPHNDGDHHTQVHKTDANPESPGGLTNSTPGMTGRVRRALATARASTAAGGQATEPTDDPL